MSELRLTGLSDLARGRLLRGRQRAALFLTLPALATIAILVVYPLGYSIVQSFTSPDGNITAANFVGAIGNPAFRTAFTNTVLYTVIMVSCELVLGLVVAISLQEVRPRVRNVLRALFLIPLLVAPVVASYQWSWLLNGQYGVINVFLRWLGLAPPLWLASPGWAFVIVILVDLWISTPFAVLIFQSALASLPDEIYEAVRLDGASRWQSFRLITTPLLRPALVIVLIIRTMDAFRIYDIIAVLTGGGPGSATTSLSVEAVQTGINIGNLNGAAAMSILTLLPVLVVTLVYLRLIRTSL